MSDAPRPYGLVAEFDRPEPMLAALQRLRAAGFRRIEVYSPEQVEGVDEILERRPSRTPLVVFAAGVVGAAGGFFLQWYGSVIGYPLNIGGRPLNSWPAFGTTTIELAILCMVLAGTAALLRACRMPLLYHPIFDAPGIERASRDRFLVCIEAGDPRFDPDRLRRLLHVHDPVRLSEVPA
ncbi:DUF3341 domain-containing protein [Skermanella rosea]|uniref:DUF3341 domain-containing protein n=1 Tax=Skermanella rosea TaxID=1817965 RepID=UPI0019334407|nr:DUF3341 domain-containing protein [Skermanella rosea]UEM01796.1 DUF3341 domain-containing protein [Skermanella rosea]